MCALHGFGSTHIACTVWMEWLVEWRATQSRARGGACLQSGGEERPTCASSQYSCTRSQGPGRDPVETPSEARHTPLSLAQLCASVLYKKR